MTSSHVFISHSSRDDVFVRALRQTLESLNIPTWVDSRELAGGSKLEPEVAHAIESARVFLAVLSQNAVNSPWVSKEIQKALEVERGRKGEGYRVVPLLLPGIEPSALALWFKEEPVGIPIKGKAGGLSEALPAILAALEGRLPDDPQPIIDVMAPPVEELVLELRDLRLDNSDGKQRSQAIARTIYEPADRGARRVESGRYVFTAPLGVIDAEELRWYLEEYFVWPVGFFRERAERLEKRLPEWGQALYQMALASDATQEALTAWQQAGEAVERRFSVFVERELPLGASEEDEKEAGTAAAELLALPWELLHDGRGFLFHGKNAVRVRRRLPNRHRQPVRPIKLPIRVLLVSPRPEEEGVSYIDHRVSALPLVEAVEELGELARLTVLSPPTFGALEKALRKADEADEAYDVVHFDGHGIYDRRVGLGGLCFEDPKDVEKLSGRAMELVHAERLAEVLRDYRVPLVFLEACQSAKTESDPTASVAARLLEEGVASVVAMSHTVLVETARLFVTAFYKELVQGRRVGTAMIAGQRELHFDTLRGRMLGVGELRLQDWFVPVLYQEEQDPQLIAKLPPEDVRQLRSLKRRLSLGELPEPPAHHFIGRSRELLALERLLREEPWVVIRGQGGEGKTTLAAELARWLVRTGRFERAAFITLEHYADIRGVLDSLGRQLLPEGDGYSVANYPDVKQALQPVERALNDGATIIVLDNLESALPYRGENLPFNASAFEELMGLCRSLLDSSPATRLVYTTREPLRAPLTDGRREVILGALGREDAIRLVSEVMKREGLEPKSEDSVSDPPEVAELVDAVGRHARALVLLSREVARSGVKATTENLRRLMEGLNRQFPGDRENSLYASLELSLRRLPTKSRERVKALVAFHGGVHLTVLRLMLGLDRAGVTEFARQLVDVGLAQFMGDNHMRLDPALPSYLLKEIDEEELEAVRSRWAEGMGNLTSFLYQQRSQNAKSGARLTLLELPNLLAMLRRAEEKATPEEAVDLASVVEQLLADLGRPQALAEAIGLRERVARRLDGWGQGRFMASGVEVERLRDRGDLQGAIAAAELLLQRCLNAGEGAYPMAPYHLSLAHSMLGTVLQMSGASEKALPLLTEALRRFDVLAKDGNTVAAHMAATVLKESADCLADLGQLDEAAAAYEDSIRRADDLGDQRQIAISKAQLGTVRKLQGRHPEALAAHEDALRTFESLGEPGLVATAWHQLGSIYRDVGQHEQAERAYRKSLAIKVQQKNPTGEAASLNELGNVYKDIGQWEEAAKFYSQAASIHIKLQNQLGEGRSRGNLSITLFRLGRQDEARRELIRAIECLEPYGHVGEVWTAWSLLHTLDLAAGEAEAAAEARQKAYESYLAYRREGGYGTTPPAQLCAAAAVAIKAGDTSGLEQYLSQLLGEDTPPQLRAMFPKLLAVLHGERDPALAADPGLDYRDAVELHLLLKMLEKV